MSGTLPLFEKYPALSGLPHVRLGLFPTPVQELHGLSESDNRVFIKRDDLSGLEYGGNKVRKLEFALGEAKANGCTDVITFGCDGSNHALATGIYAGKLGMHSISILRTQHNTRYLRKNLLKSAFYGIELHHCETKQEMDALTDTLVAERLAEGKKAPYIVPVGGSSPLGTVGFVNAAFELAGQIAAGQLPEPDYIYAADGTNGTVAGLMIGLKALGLKTQVIPVRVNDESRVNVAAISRLIDDTVALLRGYDPSFPAVHIPAEDIPLLHDFFGSDYALFTEEGVAALRRMNAMFGIELEGTYTGKTLAALLAAAMALCNDAALTDGGAQGEPTEAALVNFAAQQGCDKRRLETLQPRAAEAPFDSSRKMMSTIHRTDSGFVQYTKGAPDEVLRRCTAFVEDGQIRPMTEEKRAEILAENHAMADKALRVLAAAERFWPGGLPEDVKPESLEQQLCFNGVGILSCRPQTLLPLAQCLCNGFIPQAHLPEPLSLPQWHILSDLHPALPLSAFADKVPAH